jgi:hypothetical protein
MPVVKVTYSEDDIQLLDRDATISGVSRAELIRQRTLIRQHGTKQFTPTDYHRLVSEVATFTRGSFDRHQLESIVAFTLNNVLA